MTLPRETVKGRLGDMGSELEERFLRIWEQEAKTKAIRHDLNLTREWHFHPERKWRFDFAHRPTLVAIEIEGGLRQVRKVKVRGKDVLFSGGRHNSASGFEDDAEKYASAVFRGWAVIRLPGCFITAGSVCAIMDLIQYRGGMRAPSDRELVRAGAGRRRWTADDVAAAVKRGIDRSQNDPRTG